ncbi:TPA: TaqI-like C-terminal specificity domain-containing protein [Flavobacterium psychrophilum]
MSLFQNSVVSKYLKNQNATLLVQKWEAYKNHFLNLKVQEDIKGLKEEQYQGEFLEDLFVKILGYTKPASSTETKFNLTTEYKNVKDSKKADGAIIINDKVIAVIELKGTNTTDLGKIETQAFGYKNNQPDCVYVITSNFEKIRFYIDNAIEFLEFNLFQLTKTEFELLYLCLAYDNLSKGIAKTIKDESVSQEDVITKKLYKDYSLFKRELYQNLVALNPQYEPIELFKKSQKLLDRFLFIFFAEDRNLLPTNLIFRINKEWQNLRTMRIEVSLYDRYKIYFNDLNSGAKVQLPAFSQTTSNVVEEHQIFAYNGGLFKADAILDHIKIDDAVLFKHTENLSNYDFASEVDVNILGHIFENSLNELDEIKAQLEGESIDKTKTKRKKDGVFYTPKYITKYIVENTVGKLCEEKKTELQLVDEDYTTDKKRQKKTLQALIDKVENYRSWLLQLTICDPACGSGAFLNQALDFLIAEHQYIDELKAKLFGDTFVLSDVETSILENNLFGVDLNEESVEIAKLSLWLRTAQPNRKLNDLSNNIQCGNSLIDDVSIAGDKAFNWQQAFAKVFAKGGFDVIIGNPPYVFTRGNDHFKDLNEFIWRKFKYNKGKLNLYSVFLELTLSMILKPKGSMGFITPETFIRTSTYQEIRKFVINNYNLRTIQIYGIGVFENVTAETVIMIIDNNFDKNNISYFEKIINSNSSIIYEETQNNFNNTPENRFVYGNSKSDEILFKKLKANNILLGEIIDVRNGVATKSGKNDFISKSILTEKYKKLLEAPELFRYGFKWAGNYINYDKEALHRPRKEETFLSDKIMIQRVSSRLICSFDNEQFYTFNSVNNLIITNSNFTLKYLITILNSKIIDYFYRKNYSLDASYTITVTKQNLDSIPIPIVNNTKQQPFIEKADTMLSLNKTLQQQQSKVINMLQRDYGLEKPTKKLETWYELTVQDFFKELAKAKIVLSAIQKDEVQEYFETYQKQAVATKNQITATDKQIDAMVYELYGLSKEEIEIVENS